VGGASTAPREEVSTAAALTHQIKIDLMPAHAGKVELPNVQEIQRFYPTQRFLLWPWRALPCAQGTTQLHSPSFFPQYQSCFTMARRQASQMPKWSDQGHT
jgi:hypothetical protein